MTSELQKTQSEEDQYIPLSQGQIESQRYKFSLAPEDVKKLADFFSVLIEIDQKNKRKGNENGKKD